MKFALPLLFAFLSSDAHALMVETKINTNAKTLLMFRDGRAYTYPDPGGQLRFLALAFLVTQKLRLSAYAAPEGAERLSRQILSLPDRQALTLALKDMGRTEKAPTTYQNIIELTRTLAPEILAQRLDVFVEDRFGHSYKHALSLVTPGADNPLGEAFASLPMECPPKQISRDPIQLSLIR